MTISEWKFYSQNPSLYKWRKKGFNIHFYKTLIGTHYQQMDIKTIIDIGANTGQSVVTFKNAFPEATIYAFEPLPNCFKQLSDNVEGISDIILYNIALGEQTGSVLFEQNEYSPSSSVLPMTKEHVKNFPFTENRKKINVNLETLDNVLATTPIKENILMKIDVQGYEKHVIGGALNTISNVKILIVETSFETMYEGEPSFDEIYEFLQKIGFKYSGSFDQLSSPQSNKILQQDAIFIRVS